MKIIVFLGVMLAALFGSAGRWDWPFAWACIGIYTAFMATTMFTMDSGLR